MRNETPENAVSLTTAAAAPSFEDVVSAWGEPLRCQSVYGCRRRATWLAIRHEPCGSQQPVCTIHYRRWLTECQKIIAQHHDLSCADCDRDFTAPCQHTDFRAL